MFCGSRCLQCFFAFLPYFFKPLFYKIKSLALGYNLDKLMFLFLKVPRVFAVKTDHFKARTITSYFSLHFQFSTLDIIYAHIPIKA